jgi:hypothetical protein
VVPPTKTRCAPWQSGCSYPGRTHRLGRPPCDPSDFVSPRKPPSSRACRAPQIAHVTQRGPPSLQSTWGPRGRQRPATVRGARRPEGEVGPRRLARCSTNLVSFCALLFSSLLCSPLLSSGVAARIEKYVWLIVHGLNSLPVHVIELLVGLEKGKTVRVHHYIHRIWTLDWCAGAIIWTGSSPCPPRHIALIR